MEAFTDCEVRAIRAAHEDPYGGKGLSPEAWREVEGRWLSTLDAVRAQRDECRALLTKWREQVRADEAVCTKAEEQRRADMSKRDENAPIMDMLREQRHAWEEKARSYRMLGALMDADTAALASLPDAKGA